MRRADLERAVQVMQGFYRADLYAARYGLYSYDREAATRFARLAGRGAAVADSARWWNSANAITALIDYMLVTGDRSHAGAVAYTFEHAPRAYEIDRKRPGLRRRRHFLNEYYDDEGWWALAWIKAYDLTHERRYLRLAERIAADMWTGWDTTCGGGIYWRKDERGPSGSKPYKNAIANELLIAVSAALATRTHEEAHRQRAQRAWSWFQAAGLIGADGLINDSLNASCVNDGSTHVWTYNQGVILGGLADLHAINHDAACLERAESIADAMISSPVVTEPPPGRSRRSGVVDGILFEHTDGAPDSIGGRQFKGIFARNLGYLFQRAPRPRYADFLRRNADSALSHASSAGEFGASWRDPFDAADFIRQSSGVDLLNATHAIGAGLMGLS